MRLGFPVRVYGCRNLPSHDARRWPDRPHLSVSLAYLRDILLYLKANHIRMYRMHSRLAPHIAHPELSDLRSQINECATELAAIGQLALECDVRLSFHPPSAVVLNALNEDQASRSVACLGALAAVMDAMNLGDEAVIVTTWAAYTMTRPPRATASSSAIERCRRHCVLAWSSRTTGAVSATPTFAPSIARVAYGWCSIASITWS